MQGKAVNVTVTVTYHCQSLTVTGTVTITVVIEHYHLLLLLTNHVLRSSVTAPPLFSYIHILKRDIRCARSLAVPVLLIFDRLEGLRRDNWESFSKKTKQQHPPSSIL